MEAAAAEVAPLSSVKMTRVVTEILHITGTFYTPMSSALNRDITV